MTGLALVVAISLFGTIGLAWWIGSVSLGIRREDRQSRHNASATLRDMAPSRESRIARQATGCHWG